MPEILMQDLCPISEPEPGAVSEHVGEPVVLSDRAAERVRSLIGDEDASDLLLRISVSGGGCSGFQYDFAFESGAADDDTRFDQKGVSVAVDPVSIVYLWGTEIDFEEGLEGARFVIKNPNATSTCSCGSSFNA